MRADIHGGQEHTNVPFKGRIQKRKTYHLQIITFRLQRAAGPYRSAITGCEQSQQGSPYYYSITSSASESKLSEILAPSDFAVLKLITNWNLTVSITGRSVGLTPLSTRPA